MSDNDDLETINARLDILEERLEDSHAEFAQRSGKSIGRDIGVLYGIIIALVLIIILMKLHIV